MLFRRREDSFRIETIFHTREYLYSLLFGFLLLAGAYAAEHYANAYELQYRDRPTSVYVGDLLLDNLPVVDLNFLVIEGALLTILIGGAYIIFWRPRYILFTMKALALAIAIRALFISLTHVGIHPESLPPGQGVFDIVYSYLNFQTGFFFSGHTALTFLTALIFWYSPRERNIFLTISFLFAIAVLLAHVHYSIDVLAAPFMAYGIYNMSRWFFPRDHKLIEEEPKAV
jgi:hypothetical protein